MGRMLLSEYITDGIAKREMYQVIEQFVDAMLETESSNQRVVLRLEEYEINNGKVVMKYVSKTNDIYCEFIDFCS